MLFECIKKIIANFVLRNKSLISNIIQQVNFRNISLWVKILNPGCST